MKAVDRRRLAAGARVAATITCLLAIGLVVARAAAATPPAQATGTGTITGAVFTVDRVAGGNRFLDGTLTATLTGTFTGTFTNHLEEVVHADGSVEFHGFGAFTGSSPCGSGTTSVEQNGSGPSTAILAGHIATLESTANVHAVVDVAQVGSTFTYSGTFHCG